MEFKEIMKRWTCKARGHVPANRTPVIGEHPAIVCERCGEVLSQLRGRYGNPAKVIHE